MSGVDYNRLTRSLVQPESVTDSSAGGAYGWLIAFKEVMVSRCGSKTPLVIGAVAILFTLPALWVGFAQDDVVFLSTFKGSPGLEGLTQPIWNTFSFSDGDLARNRLRMERGIMPWWAVEHWKVDFWRPLASLTHWVDFKLFGNVAWPMHVHSILLYGLLAASATILYRRFSMVPWAAGLAGLLFAVDAAHGIPVGWLSNRNAILAALFGILTLLAHDYWRKSVVSGLTRRRQTAYWASAITVLFLALLSNEGAVGIGGFLFAYAIFLDPALGRGEEGTGMGQRRKALTSLLPYLGLVLVWRLIYTSLGHGVLGSWMYIDPLTEPMVFLENAFVRYPVLLMGLFALPDSSIWMVLPRTWQLIHVAAAILFTGVVGWVIWPLLRRDAVARFWALGALLALLPTCATVPTDRVLMIASIGAMGLVARFLSGYVDGETWTRVRRIQPKAVGTLAGTWVTIHLLISPLLLMATSYGIVAMHSAFLRANNNVPMANAEGSTSIVLINTPLDLLGASLPFHRSGNDMDVPERWWWLSAGNRPVEVERISEKTIALRPEAGFLRRPWSQIFRRPETDPMAAGTRVRLSGMEALVITSDSKGRPQEVHFTFDVPLEDPSLKWLAWSGGTYVPFTPPPLGTSKRVDGLDPMNLLRLTLGLDRAPSIPNMVAKKLEAPAL